MFRLVRIVYGFLDAVANGGCASQNELRGGIFVGGNFAGFIARSLTLLKQTVQTQSSFTLTLRIRQLGELLHCPLELIIIHLLPGFTVASDFHSRGKIKNPTIPLAHNVAIDVLLDVAVASFVQPKLLVDAHVNGSAQFFQPRVLVLLFVAIHQEALLRVVDLEARVFTLDVGYSHQGKE